MVVFFCSLLSFLQTINGLSLIVEDELTKVKEKIASPVDSTPDVLKIMGYNILESGLHTNNAWLDVAKEENADILVAIETGAWDDNNNAILNAMLNELNTYYFDKENPYEAYITPNIADATAGATILSRYPIVNATTFTEGFLDGDVPYSLYREVLHAVVDINGIYTNILGIHLKCCSSFSKVEEVSREKDMEAIINYMDTLGNVPIILMGDFNSFSPVDTADPDLSPIPGNLGDGPISMLLNSSNPHSSKAHQWIDSYRELNPYNPGFSYIDIFYKSRIDYIFMTDFFSDKLVNATVGDTPSSKIGSDHFSVDAVINTNPAVDLRPPYRPIGLNCTIYNATSANITWIANIEPDLSHYVVYREDYRITEVNITSYFDNSLESGIHYTYFVSAVDTNGNEGTKSFPFIIETSYGVCAKPEAPILTGMPGNDKTYLTWEVTETGGLPINQFNVYRMFYNTPDGDRGLLKGTVSGDTLGYIDETNFNGVLAYWFVTAVNALGESENSNIVTVTPQADATIPASFPTTIMWTTVPAPPPPPPPTEVTQSGTLPTLPVNGQTPTPGFLWIGCIVVIGVTIASRKRHTKE